MLQVATPMQGHLVPELHQFGTQRGSERVDRDRIVADVDTRHQLPDLHPVQRLAERTSLATRRIESLVQTIQADTNEAVSSMEQTTAEVVSGARLAEDAGTALGEIERVSNDLNNLIKNISSAAQQQSTAALDITQTMGVIRQITSQTSLGAGQTAESIGHLAQLASDLRRSVADFKLPG